MDRFNPLKKLSLMLITLIIGLSPSVAFPSEKPIIVLSYGRPDYGQPVPLKQAAKSEYGASLIIKIFENGHVEYQGFYNVLLGKHEYQMDKPTLKKLIKKFEDTNFMVEAKKQRDILPVFLDSFCYETSTAIRYRKDDQETTKFEKYEMLKEILRATKAKQWGVDKVKFFPCDK